MRPGQASRGGRRRNNGGHSGHSGHPGHSSHPRPHHGGHPQHRSAQSLRNQIFDSNGPDMRVRGNAYQVHEKYQALAKDAQSSGDRVLAENYLPHAEHYFRIIQAINEAPLAEQRQRQATYEQPAMQGGQQPPQGGPPVPQGGGNGYYNSVNDLTGSSQPQNQQSFSGGGKI